MGSMSERPISDDGPDGEYPIPKKVLRHGVKVEYAVTVQRPAAELYRFWRDFENLPYFMEHLESVKPLERGRSHWKVKAPLGASVEWDAEIIDEVENEVIAWGTDSGADVPNAGLGAFHARARRSRHRGQGRARLQAAGRTIRELSREAVRRGAEQAAARRSAAVQAADGGGRGSDDRGPAGRRIMLRR